MITFKVMDGSGHRTLEFTDTKLAEAEFNKLMVGRFARKPLGDGQFEQVKKFSDVTEETIFSKNLVGG